MSDPNDPEGRQSTAAAQGPEPLRRIRIVRGDEDTIVVPVLADATFAPFSLAKVPKSLVDQLVLLAEHVWAGHRRCVGVLLLLDPERHTWSCAVPRQRAGPTASCWSGLRADLSEADADAVDRLLAGSFQVRVLEPGEEPADAPPPHDGVYFVLVLSRLPRLVHTFLRCDGETLAVPAADVLHDDLDAAVRAYLPRLGPAPG